MPVRWSTWKSASQRWNRKFPPEVSPPRTHKVSKPGQSDSESGVFAMRSQVRKGSVVACAMERRLGPIFNAANDAVEQALSKTSLAELVRGVG